MWGWGLSCEGRGKGEQVEGSLGGGGESGFR